MRPLPKVKPRDKAHVPPQPERPSHFNEDLNEYIPRDQTTVDYPTEPEAVSPVVGHPPVMAEPVPVFLTETPPRERVIRRPSFATFGIAADRAQKIASNDRRRVRLLVRNLDDANTVYIAAEGMSMSTANAYPLEPSTDALEMLHNSEVWAFCAPTETANIAVLAETEVDDRL